MIRVMAIRRRSRAPHAVLAVVAVAAAAIPLDAAPTAATTPPPEPPPTPPPVSPAFLPGIWKGAAIGTGVISGPDVNAFFSEPFRMKFEFEVAPDGTVVNGVWSWTGEVTMAGEDVVALFSMTASGTVAGAGTRVQYAGVIHEVGTVTVNNQEFPIDQNVDAAGAFSPTSVSCAVATGDVATEGRALQEGAGMSTTVTGPFTAQRTASPDAAADFEQAFGDLVLEAQALIAQGLPAVADVLALAEKAEDFYQNVFATGRCAGGAPNLMPGKQAYTYFVKVIGELVLTALANADAYDAHDINVLAIAALRIGVIGAAAPEPALATEVLEAFRNTLEQKLAEAQAAGDQAACDVITITASALGMTQVWADAVACGTG